MSVFRVERNRNYTVMSNYHLRDRRLSLKAKGLLSQMLSLPDDWDYTLGGLAQINREKVDAIRAAVRELEAAGYIVRSRERDAKGRLRGADYVIYEHPQVQTPVSDSPTLENPMLEDPALDFPASGNPTQLNKDKQSKELQNTDSLPFCVLQGKDSHTSPRATPASEPASFCPKAVHDQIELDTLCRQNPEDAPLYQEIAGLLTDTLASRRETIRVSGMDLPKDTVRKRLYQLTSEHVRFVVESLKQNRTQVRNPKQYILAALFNAPVSMYTKTALDVGRGLSVGFQPPEKC